MIHNTDKIGQNIKRIRQSQGLTCYALGQKAGVNDSSIQAIESGEYLPSITTFLKLAEALHVSAKALLEGVKEEGDF